MMNQSAREALYNEFRALRHSLTHKQLDCIEAERSVERIKSDIERFCKQSQELLDFAAENGEDLELLHQERIALGSTILSQ